MALATEAEVRELRRTVRRLEDDIARMRHDRGQNGAAPGGGGQRGDSGE
jgi:hypothetical protein